MWQTTSDILIWVFAILLVLINLGAVVMVIFQLPGTWTMLGLTGLFSGLQIWIEGWEARMVGPVALGVLLLLAVAGEVVETVAGASGAAKAGGTRTAAVLAIVGGIVGAIVGTILIPILIVGTVAGACAGAGGFAVVGDLMRGRTFADARLTGQGAVIGKLWGTVIKVLIAVVMWAEPFANTGRLFHNSLVRRQLVGQPRPWV